MGSESVQSYIDFLLIHMGSPFNKRIFWFHDRPLYFLFLLLFFIVFSVK